MQFPSHKHILSLNNSTAADSLFVIPGTGGRCEGFRNLGVHFAPAFRVVGFHMMGTEKSEIPLATIPGIAAQNIHWMRSLQPVGPYTLMGHSFGAYVAYEMVRQLEQEGEVVSMLIILDQPASFEPVLTPGDNAIFYALQLAKDYFRDFQVMDQWPEEWSRQLLPPLAERKVTEFAGYIGQFVQEKLQAKKRMIELVTRFINLRLHNAVINYSLAKKVQAGILLVKAADEKRFNESTDMGWAVLTSSLRVLTVPGNHISLVYGENAAAIVDQLHAAAV